MTESAPSAPVLPSVEDLLRMCIETPSLSNDEAALLKKLKEVAEASGTSPEIIEGAFGIAVIWEGKDGKDTPLYLFDGHVDTVPVASDAEKAQWKTHPFKAELIDGKMYGKGSCDQIGGYVSAYSALLEVAQQTDASSRAASMGIVLSRNEELAEGVASQDAVAALKEAGFENVVGVISTEPSSGKLIRGQMGRLRLLIKDTDPQALARLIADLQTYERLAEVTGKKQALALIGADLLGPFDGRIDSQVPDSASARFQILRKGEKYMSMGLTREILMKMEREGRILAYEMSADGYEIQVKISGQTCHSAFPEKGISAGQALAELVNKVREHRSVSVSSLNLLSAHAGNGTPATEGTGEAYYDYRIDAGEAPEELVGHVKERMAELALPGEVTGSCEVFVQSVPWLDKDRPVEQHFPGWLMPEDSPLLTALRAGVNTVGETEEDTWGFCTNCSGWGLDGELEMAGMGPGDSDMAHQPNEHVPMAEVELVRAKFVAFLRSVLAGTEAAE